MQTCPYILYVFQIQKGMSHELGFFLVWRVGGGGHTSQD